MPRKKKVEEAPAGSPAWMATFSDLMNLLLCFFVLLYSMSSIDAEKYDAIRASLSNSISIFQSGKSFLNESSIIETGVEQLDDLNQHSDTSNSNQQSSNSSNDYLDELLEQKEYYSTEIYDEISEMFEEQSISSDKVNMSIDSDYNYVELTINGSILFDSGSAELKSQAYPILSKVGDILKVYDEYLIEIEGHTDNVPISSNVLFTDNLWLSTARAMNAANYLVEQKGLNPKTLKSSGRGEHEPVASNETAEGRQKNRRVEIKIYHVLSSY